MIDWDALTGRVNAAVDRAFARPAQWTPAGADAAIDVRAVLDETAEAVRPVSPGMGDLARPIVASGPRAWVDLSAVAAVSGGPVPAAGDLIAFGPRVFALADEMPDGGGGVWFALVPRAPGEPARPATSPGQPADAEDDTWPAAPVG